MSKKIRLTPIVNGKILYDNQCVINVEDYDDAHILESWIDCRFAEMNGKKYYDDDNRVIITYDKE